MTPEGAVSIHHYVLPTLRTVHAGRRRRGCKWLSAGCVWTSPQRPTVLDSVVLDVRFMLYRSTLECLGTQIKISAFAPQVWDVSFGRFPHLSLTLQQRKQFFIFPNPELLQMLHWCKSCLFNLRHSGIYNIYSRRKWSCLIGLKRVNICLLQLFWARFSIPLTGLGPWFLAACRSHISAPDLQLLARPRPTCVFVAKLLLHTRNGR